MRWVETISMDLPALQIVLEDHIGAVITSTERVRQLEGEIERMLPGWRLGPVVRALQSMRGIGPVTAATIVAETGDMNRFPSPRPYMAFIGIIPSEHSTGDTIRRGKITKTGNSHLRYALVEAAKQYCHKARITRGLMKRQEDIPKDIVALAWKAQKRLCRRFSALVMRGKHRNKTAVAIARELAGFVWALARQVPIAA